MSKTSRVISVRIKLELIQEIEAALASRNMTTGGAWMTPNEWIVKAIKDKLDHLKRSKRKARKLGPFPEAVEGDF